MHPLFLNSYNTLSIFPSNATMPHNQVMHLNHKLQFFALVYYACSAATSSIHAC
jgi:hypothetical protein